MSPFPPATPPSRWPPAWRRSGRRPGADIPRDQAPAPGAGAATAPDTTQNGLLAGLDWLDSLSLTGLDGQNLNEIGLKNGNLVVDDQQRGNKWTFENISLSLRRPSGGGVALSLGEEGAMPGRCAWWSGRPQTACDRSISAPTRSRPPISCWRCG